MSGSDDDEGFYNKSEEEDGNVEREIAKISTKKNAFKKKTKRVRKVEKGVKKPHKEKESKYFEIAEGQASAIIDEMDKRYHEDAKAYQNKRPAAKKLIYIPELSKQLKNVYVCEKFLEFNGLVFFEKWLGKLPDGHQPSLSLRKGLFEILLFLKVRGEHIGRAQQLQKIIQKHKKSQAKELRDLSEAIMIKWGEITYDEINE